MSASVTIKRKRLHQQAVHDAEEEDRLRVMAATATSSAVMDEAKQMLDDEAEEGGDDTEEEEAYAAMEEEDYVDPAEIDPPEKKRKVAGKRAQQDRAYAFFITINYKNDEGRELQDDEIDAMIKKDVDQLSKMKVRYIIVGKHIGDNTHVPHIHAAFWFKSQKALSTIIEAYPRAHVGKCVSTPAKCKKYILKNKMKLLERGVPPRQGGHIEQKVIDEIERGDDLWTICAANPSMGLRYVHGIERLIEAKRYAEANKPDFTLYPMWPWQKYMLYKINEKKVDEREIVWFYDPHGGQGKTWMCKYLYDRFKCQYFQNAATKDIMEVLDDRPRTDGRAPIIIFDFAKAVMGQINYGVMEILKNGIGLAPKYRGRMKRWATPHVFVFANFHPDWSKFTAGRIRFLELDKPTHGFVNPSVWMRMILPRLDNDGRIVPLPQGPATAIIPASDLIVPEPAAENPANQQAAEAVMPDAPILPAEARDPTDEELADVIEDVCILESRM